MPTQSTFLEIFRQIDADFETETMNSAGWETSLEPAWLSQLMVTLEPIKFINASLAKYGRPLRQIHIFNHEQQQAFDNLNFYQTKPLHPGFYAYELKSAYRVALLKTHPDQGGTAESFQQIRKSYEILQSFVTK